MNILDEIYLYTDMWIASTSSGFNHHLILRGLSASLQTNWPWAILEQA